MFALTQDITERKRVEDALRENEEKYRTIFEQSRDAIFTTSPEGRIVDVNQAALDLFRFTREEAIAVDVGERIVHPAERDRFRQEIDENGSVSDFEVKFYKKDGTVMDCLLTATRRRAEDGSSLGIQGIVRDITERKQAEEQRRELAVLEERNRLAREIHDTLAQGFTGIVLQLEAAEQGLEESPADVPEHLSRAKGLARESLQEARRSVWDLVPRALEESPLDLALKEEVRRFTAAGRENASFSLSGDRRELPSNVQADLLRICQESLTNIRRHAEATEVTVGLTFRPEAVCLEVQDNGIGFDSEEVRDGDRQSGFGLRGMEQRVRLMEGTLAIKSQKGKGTLVEVRIPTA